MIEKSSLVKVWDCVVVGGGISGLAAANELLSHEKKNRSSVLVLEANDRLGGRIHRNGKIDLGARYIGDEHHNLCQFVNTKKVLAKQRGKVLVCNKDNYDSGDNEFVAIDETEVEESTLGSVYELLETYVSEILKLKDLSEHPNFKALG